VSAGMSQRCQNAILPGSSKMKEAANRAASKPAKNSLVIAALLRRRRRGMSHLQALTDAAKARGIELSVFSAKTPEEIVPALDSAKSSGAGAINVAGWRSPKAQPRTRTRKRFETCHEFLARRRVVAKTSQHSARNKRYPVLMPAPGGHASVGRLYATATPCGCNTFSMRRRRFEPSIVLEFVVFWRGRPPRAPSLIFLPPDRLEGSQRGRTRLSARDDARRRTRRGYPGALLSHRSPRFHRMCAGEAFQGLHHIP
jgi:hypothetical protein